MLEQVVKPLSSGSILPWLTASRIVTTNSLSQLATPSSISSDQSLTLSGSATATVAGLFTAQSALTVASTATLQGIATVVDGNFSIVGSGDSTKTIKFEVDAQTAADDLTINSGAQSDDRTLTVPVLTGDATLAVLSETQTFTGAKTFSSASGVSITGAGGLSVTTGTASIVGAGAGVVIEAGSNARNASTYINVNAVAGNNRAFTFQTAGSFRWLVTCNGTAESGANAGSDFAWNAYDDSGSFIDSPLTIARMSGGTITITRPVTLSAASSGLTISKTTGTTLSVVSTDTSNAVGLFGGMTMATGKNLRMGTAAVATTATAGFIYLSTCAGTPTGVPTTLAGTAPIVIDTTNNKLYFYSGGAWRDAGP